MAWPLVEELFLRLPYEINIKRTYFLNDTKLYIYNIRIYIYMLEYHVFTYSVFPENGSPTYLCKARLIDRGC